MSLFVEASGWQQETSTATYTARSSQSKEVWYRSNTMQRPKGWRKSFDPKTVVQWRIFPTLADIRTLIILLKQVCFFNWWHPLAKAAQLLAAKAASIKVSYSWP